jgi:predicted Zn finger-like uncharacterized protein
MLIVCPSCATSYMIDPATLGPAGRTVRCARCKSTWFAGGPHEADADAAGPQIEAEAVVSGFAEATAETAESRPPTPPTAGLPTADFADADGGTPPAREPLTAIADAPPLAPSSEQAEAAPPEDDSAGYAVRRLRMQSRRHHKRRSSRWTALVLVLFAVNVALLGARNEVVRYLPQTASLFAALGMPVNLRHLDFENVRIVREVAGGTTILVVQGSIVNTASSPVEVPHLRFAARNKAGQEIYSWTMQPDRGVLQPGEHLAFRSQFASPPKDAHDVMVRFLTANDAMAGVK